MANIESDATPAQEELLRRVAATPLQARNIPEAWERRYDAWSRLLNLVKPVLTIREAALTALLNEPHQKVFAKVAEFIQTKCTVQERAQARRLAERAVADACNPMCALYLATYEKATLRMALHDLVGHIEQITDPCKLRMIGVMLATYSDESVCDAVHHSARPEEPANPFTIVAQAAGLLNEHAVV